MKRYIIILLPLIFLSGLTRPDKPLLSQYGFFSDLKSLEPRERTFAYDLNTPLFSDYAWKSRFMYVPEGKDIKYRDSATFLFPEGAVLIKNFYYPEDFRKPEGNRRIIETRLLIREENNWKALPYIWNEEQTDARLSITGGITEVEWRHFNGKKKKLEYVVPNINQCKSCHSVDGKIQPIGPAVRHLNRDGLKGNQIQYLSELEVLTGLPENELPKNAVWNDPSTGTLAQRARSYLDINCAHCHDEKGTARNTGLFLGIDVLDDTQLGIFKPPVAAGTASNDLLYDIVPGKPHESILLSRMITNDIGKRMPEIGRSMMDEEGVRLIREWIESLD